MPQRSFVFPTLVHVLRRIAPITVDPEDKQQQTTGDLHDELIFRIGDKVHHEAHPKAGDQCIDNVRNGCAYASDEAIPSALVQRALDTENTDWAHGR